MGTKLPLSGTDKNKGHAFLKHKSHTSLNGTTDKRGDTSFIGAGRQATPSSFRLIDRGHTSFIGTVKYRGHTLSGAGKHRGHSSLSGTHALQYGY